MSSTRDSGSGSGSGSGSEDEDDDDDEVDGGRHGVQVDAGAYMRGYGTRDDVHRDRLRRGGR